MTPPLTSKQEKVLENIYYEEKNFFGRDRLFNMIKERGLDISRRQIMDFLKLQEVHQLTAQTRRSNIIQPTILTAPNKQIGIDLIDMQNLEFGGYKYILTGIDLFSKKAYAEPLLNKETKTVSKGMEKIINNIKEQISSIRSDNGSEFISKEFTDLLKRKNITQVFSLAGKPQSNGQIERFNAVIKKLIRMTRMTTGNYDWVSILPDLIDNYNNSVHKTTRIAPNKVNDANNEEIKKNITDKVLLNRDTDKPKFKQGDTVRIKLIRTTKEDYNWSKELYVVLKVSSPKTNISATSYKVKDKITNEHMKDKFYNNDLLFIPGVQNYIKVPKKDIISSISRPSIQKGIPSYLVRWKEPTDELYTYEPRDKLLADIPKIVNAFDKKHAVEWQLDKGRFTWKK